MPLQTTVRVDITTRDEVRKLAEADGLTMDEMISRLAKAERQRRMGIALAAAPLDESDISWIESGLKTVTDAAR